jgi:hypothetical protein
MEESEIIILKRVIEYESLIEDLKHLRIWGIILIFLTFIIGFIIFIVISNKRKKLYQLRKEIIQEIDSHISEIGLEKSMEYKQRLYFAGKN